MVNPDKTFQTKLGTTRAGERTRIWLEGNRLIAHGFNRGECAAREWDTGKLVLRHIDKAQWEALPRDERTTVAGTDARPIIDISTAKVAETFQAHTSTSPIALAVSPSLKSNASARLLMGLHNIEKSGFRKGEYVGYANGVWRIRKLPGGWRSALGASLIAWPNIGGP